MNEDDVVNVVLKVFDYVLKKHEGKGRHELNRTDLEEALNEIRIGGLPAPVVVPEKPPTPAR